MADPDSTTNDDVEVSSGGARTQCTASGKKLTSNVWADMTRSVNDNGSITATCNHCKKVLNGHPNSGTSHLKRHISSCSARRVRDVKSYCISGAGSSSNAINVNQVSLRSHVPGFDEIRDALCQFVVAGGHSFSIVEEPGFKNLMRTLAPDFQLVGRLTIKRDAISRYTEAKKLVCVELQDAPGRISFTTDNWRSENSSEEFMCLTSHWIDRDWKLQKRMIKFSALTPPFDGVSLAEEVLLCLGEWKIADKVFTITLDNASYNDTMIGSLRNHLIRKHSLLFNGQFFHMRCCCHIINLVVQAGLKLLDVVVVKIRRIIIHLRHSIPKKKKFYEIACTNFGLSPTKKLRLDMPIRWNSTFTMLDRFLYFRDPIDSFVTKDSDLKAHRLTVEDWDKVDEIQQFLHVFYDVTNQFSASKTPTANVYFHGVWSIHMHLLSVMEGPHCVVSDMVAQMQLKFAKYWGDYNLLLSCAAVLDPRMKLEGVRFCYEKLFGSEKAKEMMNKVKETLLELLEDYKDRGVNTNSAENSEAEAPNVMLDSDVSVRRRFASSPYESLFDHLSKKMKTSNKPELEQYLDEKNYDFRKEFDILEFWKSNVDSFPTLSYLARDILSVPISSVPSESAFSLGKKMITSTRSSLAADTVEALACYEDWLRVKGLLEGSSKILRIGVPVEEGEDEEESCIISNRE